MTAKTIQSAFENAHPTEKRHHGIFSTIFRKLGIGSANAVANPTPGAEQPVAQVRNLKAPIPDPLGTIPGLNAVCLFCFSV